MGFVSARITAVIASVYQLSFQRQKLIYYPIWPTEWPRQIETKIQFFEVFRNLEAKLKKYHKR